MARSHDKVERAIRALYRKAKLTEPTIEWVSNPQIAVEVASRDEYAEATPIMRALWTYLHSAGTKAETDEDRKLMQEHYARLRARDQVYRQAVTLAARTRAEERADELLAKLDSLNLSLVDGRTRSQLVRSFMSSDDWSRCPFPPNFKPAHEVHDYIVSLTPLRAIVSERAIDGPHTAAATASRWEVLHREDGPAVEFADGWKIYALQGMIVDPEVVEKPDEITPARIRRERNIELRRVMMERIGLAKYLELDGAKLLAEDVDSQGQPRKLWWTRNGRSREPMVVVEVANSTAEPDGSRKQYLLRVPPTMKTPQEAVAWTFNMTPEQYRVAYES